MRRYPGGRLSMERSRLTRSMTPIRALSRAPMSFLGPSSLCGSKVSSSETSGSPFLRKCISTTFTARRCSQVENADSPRKVAILRNNCRKASCVRSSASAVLPTMRRHSEYTRRLCRPYKASKHSESPCLARSIASCSEMPLARIFLAVVKWMYSVCCQIRCQDGSSPLPGTGGYRILKHGPLRARHRCRSGYHLFSLAGLIDCCQPFVGPPLLDGGRVSSQSGEWPDYPYSNAMSISEQTVCI